MKNTLITIFKVLIFVAVVVWVVFELHKSWDKICQVSWRADYYWLFFSALFYFLAYIPASLFWRYSMWSLGQRPGIYESLRAYYIGHLGKYVPGKAIVVVLRSGLLNLERTQASVAAAAVFLETLTMMASGAFLSALIVFIWFRGMENGMWLMLLSFAVLLCAGVPVIPPVFRWLAKRLGVGRFDPYIDQKLLGLRVKTLAVGFGLTILTWLMLGLSLWGVVNGIGLGSGSLWANGGELMARFTLAASFSVVLGFVLMMPGGIGVRDFVLAQVLTVYFAGVLGNGNDLSLAASYAIVAAGVQRLISIFVELLAAVVMFRKPK
ncbi:MAG: flippase-like domain-containing protein [Planctomycetaceae bacterium]|jgi:uncharacterized membrane protein YbhN (UPF0104 family)|nr:flippase-like domain-containing protein [Planctomycetaceae bacterium]